MSSKRLRSLISLDFGYVLHQRNTKGPINICMALQNECAQEEVEFRKSALIGLIIVTQDSRLFFVFKNVITISFILIRKRFSLSHDNS